ncbi:hypothetical protein HanPSC8_Chr07g0270841 [Helianthus annuus]|nr:hypothetical protein HanPSC8_Chr07g0270841 [Helianthus annuus]
MLLVISIDQDLGRLSFGILEVFLEISNLKILEHSDLLEDT